MSEVARHFVTFYSPGTFVAEETTKPVDEWNVDAALAMARTITERYGAVPFGFRFITRSRGDDDLDAKITARSPMHYLGGKIETLAEVEARATDKDRVLVANMKGNGWDRIITNTNSWTWTQPLGADDVVLPWEATK
jgi:hypothetical protein